MRTTSFDDTIDIRTQRQLKIYKDFNSLMKCAKGIHPFDILNSIKRLRHKKIVSKTQFNKLIASANASGKIAPDNTIHYRPVPHLLDFDWRFSKSGIISFVRYVKPYIHSKTQTIVFMGTPTLFTYFVNKHPEMCKYVLLDKNALLYKKYVWNTMAHVKFCECNIADIFKINLSADIVAMDPPWYLEYNKMFIGMGSKLCKSNAIILCVTPPFLTRPTASDEYDELVAYCSNVGLSVEKYKKVCIRYSTPPFEQNTLKVNGICCMPNDWRAGDLLILRKKENLKFQEKDVPIITENNEWIEIEIGLVRIKYKKEQDINCLLKKNIYFQELYKKNIYPSVSRRYTGSAKINVWTSGNRVWYCNNVQLLDIILQNWVNRVGIQDVIQRKYEVILDTSEINEINQFIVKLEQIINIENDEYGVWQ